jgi:hypothetical protein
MIVLEEASINWFDVLELNNRIYDTKIHRSIQSYRISSLKPTQRFKKQSS